jgi:hypothetical protein
MDVLLVVVNTEISLFHPSWDFQVFENIEAGIKFNFLRFGVTMSEVPSILSPKLIDVVDRNNGGYLLLLQNCINEDVRKHSNQVNHLFIDEYFGIKSFSKRMLNYCTEFILF